MKLFDPRAALAEIKNQLLPPATSATSATQAEQKVSHVANVASVATATAANEKLNHPSAATDQDDCKHGFALNGHPKTWTGKIVSLDGWRQLTEWEKHGPDGRHWSGETKKWEAPE